MANSLSSTSSKEVILSLKIDGGNALKTVVEAEKNIENLKKQVKDLNEEYKGNHTEEYYKKLVQLKTELKDQQNTLKANQKVLDEQVQAYKKNEGSINSMRANLKLLRAQYEDLSKTEREGAKGEKILKDIQDQTAAIKELEQAQGDFRRNVGNYQSIWDADISKLETFGSTLASVFGMKGIGKVVSAYKSVSGFLRDFTNEVQTTGTQMKSTVSVISDTANQTKQAATVIESAATSFQDLGSQAEQASKPVAGFGAAERAAVDEAKNMTAATNEVTSATTNMGEAVSTAATATTSSAKAIGGLSGAFKIAGQAVSAFGKQMLSLLANPIVAIIAAIAVVVLKLVEAFKKNDDAMTALQTAFSAFQPIIDLINKGLNALVGVVTKVIEGFTKAATAIMSIIPGLRAASEASQQYTKDLDALEESERQYTVESAKNEAQIAELRDKAADKEKYTAEERIKFNKQAQELQENNYKAQKQLAAERLRLAKIEQKRDNDYSDERKNKIAELEAAYIKADADYYNAHRSLQREQIRFEKEIDSEEQALQKEKEQRAKEWQEKLKEMRANEVQAIREYEDAVIAAMDEGFEKHIKEIQVQGDREIEDLKKRLKEEKNLTSKARDAINNLIEQKQKDLNKRLILSQATYWSDLRAEIAKSMTDSGNFINTSRLSTDLQHLANDLKNKIIDIDNSGKKVANDLFKSFSDTFRLAIATGDTFANNLKDLIGNDILNFDNFEKALSSLTSLIATQTEKTRDEVQKMIANDKWFKELERIYKQYLSVVGDQSRQVNQMIIENTQKAAQIVQKSIFDAISNGSVTAYQDWLDNHEEFAKMMADKFGDSYLDQMKGIMMNIDSMLEEAYAKIATSNGNEYVTALLRGYIKELEEVRNVISSTNIAENEALKIRQKRSQLIIDGKNTEIELAKISIEESKAENERLKAQDAYLASIKETVKAREESYFLIRKETADQREQLEDQRLALQALIDNMSKEAIRLGVEVDQTSINLLYNQIEDIKKQEAELTKQAADAANALAATGFTSLEEFNAAQDEMTTKIMESNAKIAEETKKLNDAQIDGWLTTFNTIADAAAQLSNAFGNLFTVLAEDNEQMQKYANAMAYVDIMMSMAQGIAAAVAEGMKMGWPAAAVMIPVGVATVVSGIAEAISVYKQNNKVKSAPKFSEGGLVGNKTTNKKDDKIDAKLSEGEYVIQSKIVKEYGVDFFDRLNNTKKKKFRLFLGETPHFSNGGLVSSPNTNVYNNTTQMDFNYSQLGEVFKEAVSEIHPVVSVQEINNMQTRVAIKENIASYK